MTSTHALVRQCALAAAAACLALPQAQADTISQLTHLDFQTAKFTGTGTVTVAAADAFQVSVNPFDTSLGTLTSFSMAWSLVASTNFTVAPPPGNRGGGSASGSVGGGFLVGGKSAGMGGSGGGGTGAGPGGSGSYNWVMDRSRTWLAAQAGVTYDPALLALVTGSTPFDLRWDTVQPYALFASNVVDLVGTLAVDVTMQYDYTPASVPPAVPEPGSLALVAAAGLAGLVRRRRA